MAQLTDQAASAAVAIRENLQQKIDQILMDTNLSTQGQRLAAAKAWLAASAAMDKVRADFDGTSTSQPAALTKSLFGANGVSGADAISARDAAQRAAELETPTEASALLASAIDLGDDVLARAICKRAFDEATGTQAVFADTGWEDVVNQYVAAYPETQQAIEELAASIRTRTQAVQDNLTAAFYFAVPVPSVIGDMAPTSIQQFVGANGGANLNPLIG